MTPSEQEFNLIRQMQRQVDALDPSSLTQAADLQPRAHGQAADRLAIEIAGYDVIRECHRGGQGVVLQAVQRSTRRKVAIKVMREGPFAGAADRARFEREVQVLAALNHPHVVAIHDSGTAAGCHYFVMDYVSGQPLDVFMAGAAHSIRNTLALFAQICEAVNAAHVRGITHRDLKPGNIRVDEKGEPRILDFGLAKIAGTQSEAAAMTLTGQFLGSLPWASPEQVEGNPDKTDLRTDVYSLGVVLFQMLTGKFPYEVIGPMREVMDRVIHAQPARPRSIRRQIDDEVETIVLKCLQKDRERRYQTAGELGRDVRRYLAGEPIEAKRDSLGYLLRKQLKRYRVPATIATLFALTITAGFVAVVVLWQRATADRDAARRAQIGEAAQRRAGEAVNEFLQNMLAGAAPAVSERADLTVREMLDRAAKTVEDGSLADQPETEAAIRATIGNTYRALGIYRQAEDQLRAALAIRRRVFGEEHVDVARSMADLGALLTARGAYAEAQEMHVAALTMYRRLQSDDASSVALMVGLLGSQLWAQGALEEAEQAHREALELRRQAHGDDSLEVAENLSNLALVLKGQGKLDDAESLCRRALAMRERLAGSNHVYTAVSLNNLAQILRTTQQFNECEALYERALSIRRAAYGGDHPEVAESLSNLASLRRDQSRYDEAIVLFEEGIAMLRRTRGPDHALVAISLGNLALACQERGDANRAVELHQEAVAIARSAWPDGHPELAKCLWNLAASLRGLGRYDDAELHLREALAINRELQGETHSSVAGNLIELSGLAAARGDFDKAESLLREALTTLRSNRHADREMIAWGTALMADLTRRQGRREEAESLCRQAIEIYRALPGGNLKHYGRALQILAFTLQEGGRIEEAEAPAREALDIHRRALGDRHDFVANDLAMVGYIQMQRKDLAAAEQSFRECLQIRAANLKPGHWKRCSTMSLLGGALIAQGRFEEAEPLVLEGYRGVKAGPWVRPERRREALERVINLYEAWGKPDQADEYRAQLPSTQPTD